MTTRPCCPGDWRGDPPPDSSRREMAQCKSGRSTTALLELAPLPQGHGSLRPTLAASTWPPPADRQRAEVAASERACPEQPADLLSQLRSHGRCSGEFVLIHAIVVFAQQGNGSEPNLPLGSGQQRLPVLPAKPHPLDKAVPTILRRRIHARHRRRPSLTSIG